MVELEASDPYFSGAFRKLPGPFLGCPYNRDHSLFGEPKTLDPKLQILSPYGLHSSPLPHLQDSDKKEDGDGKGSKTKSLKAGRFERS